MYRYAKSCNNCKSKGPRNSRYGVHVSDETREKMRQAALKRPSKPRKKRSKTKAAGRDFARRWFPLPELCERCHLVPPVDRHHRDGDPQNNDPTNISCLCRRCHQIEDGRMEFLKNEMPKMGAAASHAKR